MFTGLIQEKVKILSKQTPAPTGFEITVSRPQSFVHLKSGESIALNGVCLTLTHFGESQMSFFVGQETLAKTIFNVLDLNSILNAERSLAFSDRLGGHLVSGHVDEAAEIVKANLKDGCMELEIRLPQTEFVFNKGSIAVNGVSLTVNSVDARERVISLFLIPETLERTNLVSLKRGDQVNIEYDQLAKIVSAQVKNQLLNQTWSKNEHHP